MQQYLPVTSLVRFSLAAGFVCFLLAEGCGYVGLDARVDDQESVTASGGHAPGDGDGDGDGDGVGGGGGETSGSGGDAPGDGGSFVGVGGFPERGLGGMGGFGGAILDRRPIPCSYLCDDPFLLYRSFELGLPAMIKQDPGATVERTAEIVHWDDYSLSASQGEPGTDAQITDRIRRVVGAELHLRAWMYLPEGAVVDWLKVLAFNGVSTGGIDLKFTKDGEIEIFSQMTGLSRVSPRGVVPEDEWFCLRTAMFVDNVNGWVQAAINEEGVVGVGQWDTLPAAEIDNIVYGIAETGESQTGATLYVDDVVASTEPVPCQRLY